eukprot:2436087-Pyramimonas_sp.AAC.1
MCIRDRLVPPCYVVPCFAVPGMGPGVSSARAALHCAPVCCSDCLLELAAGAQPSHGAFLE